MPRLRVRGRKSVSKSSTICNGTIVNYLDLDTEVVFYGTTLSGSGEMMGLKRACFADRYA